jgi:hypothetical protein
MHHGWEEAATIPIPRWPGIHDFLRVYMRRDVRLRYSERCYSCGRFVRPGSWNMCDDHDARRLYEEVAS